MEAPINNPIRVLLVEDSEDDAELVLLELQRSGFEVTWQRVERAEEMLLALDTAEWDIVLTDHVLPQFSSEQVLHLLAVKGCDIPCIIVSGMLGEEMAVAAMRTGAADYMLKDNLVRLGAAVEREVREFKDRRARRQAEEMVDFISHHDQLTGLPNRARFEENFARALEGSNGGRKMLATMFLDIDRFKQINDTLGHAAGDEVMRTVADRLLKSVRFGDCVGRWGGDEFALLFVDLARVENAAHIAQKLLDTIREPMTIHGHELFVTGGIGIALYPSDGSDVSTLTRNAEAAMYRSKEQGRDEYQFYTRGMNARAFERLALEASLRRALERDQLVVYYQPQVDARTEMIVGMEALVRWRHPDLGLVYPSQFIPLAEETGLIVPIGLWVLNSACAQNKAWQDAGLPPFRVAVNLSARQFRHHNLVNTIASVLKETGLAPEFLELEITEGVALQYANFTSTMLNDLKAMGIVTAIDDFGTGYSSLSTLNRFPFDKLKIDQSFVRNIDTDTSSSAIAMSMIVLAKSLHRKVIAEGVETYEQLELLRSHGCDEVQGYLFGRPMAAEDATRLLEEQKARVSHNTVARLESATVFSMADITAMANGEYDAASAPTLAFSAIDHTIPAKNGSRRSSSPTLFKPPVHPTIEQPEGAG